MKGIVLAGWSHTRLIELIAQNLEVDNTIRKVKFNLSNSYSLEYYGIRLMLDGNDV